MTTFEQHVNGPVPHDQRKLHTKEQILHASIHGCATPVELLRAVVDEGVEFPDAVWKVSQALGMKPDEVQEMEAAYDQEKTP